MTFSAATDAGAQFTKSPNPKFQIGDLAQAEIAADAPSVDVKRGTTQKGDMAFARCFPNSVVRDPETSSAELFYLALRSTFADSKTGFRGDPETLSKYARRGFGRDVAERAIAEAKAKGRLKRWQPPRGPDGRFSEAREILKLPAAGKSGKAGRFLYRGWFGGLTVEEMVVLFYIRAGVSRGRPHPYLREIAERFGCSRASALKHVGTLLKRGLIDRIDRRKDNGQRDGTQYSARRLAAGKLMASEAATSAKTERLATPVVAAHGTTTPAAKPSTTVQKPGHGSPGHGSPGHRFPGHLRTYQGKPLTYCLRQIALTYCLRQNSLTH